MINKMLILAMGLRCANQAISYRSETVPWLNFNDQLCSTLFPSVPISVLLNYHRVTYCDCTVVHTDHNDSPLQQVQQTLATNSHKNYDAVELFPLTRNNFKLQLFQTVQFSDLRCTDI